MTLKTLQEREKERKLGRADSMYQPRQPYANPIFEESEEDEDPTAADEPPLTGAPTANVIPKNNLRKWILSPPEGFPAEPNAFKHCCVLVSLVLGKWLFEKESFVRPVTERDNSILHYFKKPSYLSNMVGRYLKNDIIDLAATLKINVMGPYKDRNTIFKMVAVLWKVQILVYSENSPPKINFMTPRDLNFELPAIYLLFTINASSENRFDHIDLIKNICIFWNLFGITCPCGKSVSYKQYNHQCYNYKSCFACHRYFATPQTFICPLNEFMFCDRNINLAPFVVETCPRCHTKLHSAKCKAGHTKAICKMKGFYCLQCKRLDMGVTKLQEKSHICFKSKTSRKCHSCWTEEGENHICKWALPHLGAFFPNLGFVHFKLTTTEANCVSCLEKEKKGQNCCSLHLKISKEKKIEVLCCGVTVETDQRETFETFILQDSVLNQVECEPNRIILPYLPNANLVDCDLTQLNFKKKKGRFGNPVRKNIVFDQRLQELKQKKKKTAVEAFICKFISEKYRNYTFVLSNDSHLQHILTALILNDFSVDSSLIVKQSTVILLTVKAYGISFISAAEFQNESFLDLSEQLKLKEKMKYFPEALSNKAQVNLKLTQAPDLKHYLDLSDSSQTAKEKTKFWESIKYNPFDFQESLLNVCIYELNIHVCSSINLLKTSLDFQVDCLNVLGKPAILESKHAPFLNPFSYVSLGSFVHEAFRLWAISPETPLYSVMPPNNNTVSLGEVEFVSYLTFCFPGQFVTAFSSKKGQHRITKPGVPTIIPDAFGVGAKQGHLHFYNGCW